MGHAWCKDVARDERVRAAEDGRAAPLPTLGECIERQKQTARPCGGTDPAPSRGERGAADTGMRTERVTLEVTHDLDARLSDWIVEVVDESLGMMESVRVVDDAAQAASGGGEQPRGWLTEEERKWIEYMKGNCVLPYAGIACMEAILARSTPPEVVLPNVYDYIGFRPVYLRADVIAALAAAGVAVKEVRK